MKKQILIINGGTTYSNYNNYIEDLKNKKIDLEKFKYQLGWKESVASDLGDEYEVFVPKMPNITNAKYNEWRIWFERVILLLNEDVILVGHSLGGIFLAKYLSENIIKIKPMAVILVAAPFKSSIIDEELASFSLTRTLKNFNEQISNIILFQNTNDPVVPIENVWMYKKQLPDSKIIVLEADDHFKQEHFPELVDLIKSL